MKSLIALCLLSSSLAFAATQNSMVGQQSTDRSELPTNGQSMDTVKERFGIPADEKQPVGQPPISRWVYSGFTVYFEGDKVIHSVRHANS